ncbi:hypothetical protein [Halorientalis regularis]|uniref:Uncharacterized protein n=1 Tax=Halorientalis regularis TaxID=660518 RepID=A0A1G7FL60_9EURY|nr:hypothetical protein [Halorientalis regularis]SDE76657.1 hypothetical protein SAMN05216218_101245 [Halorientalis regularis]
MGGVLNEVTNTVHKQETGKSKFQTECGVTYNLSEEDLRVFRAVESELDGANVSKCGRCFDDAGGY